MPEDHEPARNQVPREQSLASAGTDSREAIEVEKVKHTSPASTKPVHPRGKHASRKWAWLVKAAAIFLISCAIEQGWLNKLGWYRNLPNSAYLSQQQALQDDFFRSGAKNSTLILDASASFPPSSSFTTTQAPIVERANIQHLSELIPQLVDLHPSAIEIDLYCAPRANDFSVVAGKTVLAGCYINLYNAIIKANQDGIPTTFIIPDGSQDLFRNISLGNQVLAYAGSSSMPDTAVGNYRAFAFTSTVNGLIPIALRTASLLRKVSPAKLANETNSTILTSRREDAEQIEGEQYWVNFETLLREIKTSYDFSALNGQNSPSIAKTAAGKTLPEVSAVINKHIVVIGRLKEPLFDHHSFPVSELLATNPEQIVETVVGDAEVYKLPVGETSEVYKRYALNSAQAGVLFQTASLHTLLDQHVYTLKNPAVELSCIAIISIGLVWPFSILSEKLRAQAKLKHNSPKHDLFESGGDVFSGLLRYAVFLWAANAIARHHVLLLFAPAVSNSLILESGVSAVYLLYKNGYFRYLKDRIRRNFKRPLRSTRK